MVGTRGNKEDIVTERTSLSREKRKASRGALEEPEDEIFWDSDEARLTSQELQLSPSSKKTTKCCVKLNKLSKESSISPNSNIGKDKDSSRKGQISSRRSKSSSFSGREDSVSLPTSYTDKSAHKNAKRPKVVSPNKPKSPLTKSKLTNSTNKAAEMTGKKNKRSSVSALNKLADATFSKASDSADEDGSRNYNMNETMDGEVKNEQHNASQKKNKEGVNDTIHQKVKEDSESDEQVDNKKVEEEDDNNGEIEMNENATEEEFNKSGLRRSSRGSIPTWLVGPKKLKGYPSPGSKKDGQDSRFVEDSDDNSELEIFNHRGGRYGRPTRRPKRYQEDTDEEEEISRGRGRPRGVKGGGGSSAANKKKTRRVVGPMRRRQRHSEDEIVEPRSRRRLPRVAYDMDSDTDEAMAKIASMNRNDGGRSRKKKGLRPVKKTPKIEDEDEQEEDSDDKENETVEVNENEEKTDADEQQNGDIKDVAEEEVKDNDQTNEDSGEETKTYSAEVRRSRRRRRYTMPLSEEDGGEEEDDEAEDWEEKKQTNKKKLLDPVLRNEDFAKSLDSYSGKKRTRRPVMRLSYNKDDRNGDEKTDNETESTTTTNSSTTSSSDERDGGKSGFKGSSGYTLRRSKRKPVFQREKRTRGVRRRDHVSNFLGSPARKPVVNYKRRTTHNKSSTTSSSDVDDERKFEKRKAKSNAKARSTMLPMNLNDDDINSLTIKERSKIGSSLADVEPMTIDRNVTFSTIGGLSNHIRSLREMVVLPLLYPEVFSKFTVTPPRGVLFYGPPGTGKTLVARALANECSIGDKKVSFFMRKGADCLSKWVGESERQLRLLFDQAYQMRPAIIFFDEIDGLAPVRSSRQDQIHSSIVSTLLALMDGLDSRGEIIIIGATNRIEAIDPALRRPGRFDRELCFPLPSAKAREQILTVHTNSWTPKPSGKLLCYLAEHTPGYCGADLKSLCCEAVLTSLRLKYPQVYESSVKLQLDINSMNVRLKHFRIALGSIVPAGQRSRGSIGKRLHPDMKPLLENSLKDAIKVLSQCFPQGLTPATNGVAKIIVHSNVCFRPRLLIMASKGQGDTTHLAPAIIHAMEKVPVHKLDLASLHSNSSRTPEEAVSQIIHEACSRPPSILYLPYIDRWFESNSESVKATFLTLLDDINPSTPLLFIATSHTPLNRLDDSISDLFCSYRGEVFTVNNPTKEERQKYFKPLFYTYMIKIKTKTVKRKPVKLLPIAQVVAPRRLSEKELQRLVELEEATLRELRIFLRQICSKLARNRQFCIFSQPVDIEDIPDYLDIIEKPMDLETMMTKIDRHEYICAQDFLKDIDLICANALEYNPNHSPEDQHIRHTACALRDTAYTLIKTEMDTDFEDKCRDIRETRDKRNDESTNTAPDFIYTAPLQSNGSSGSNNSKANDQSNGNRGISNGSHNGGGSTRKKRKRSAWSRGLLNKPKKKAHLDKSVVDNYSKENSSDNNNTPVEEDTTANLDDCTENKADSTTQNNVDMSSSHNDESNDTPLQMTKASNSCEEEKRDHKKKIKSSNSPLIPKSKKSSPTANMLVAGSSSDELEDLEEGPDDLTGSSSEKEEETPTTGNDADLFVDWSHLDAAYGNCVGATSGATISQLQMIYTALMRLIRRHSQSHDKSRLLVETEDEIRNFAQHKKENN